jgi:hypothetical protein
VGFESFLMFTAFCRWNNWPPVIAEIMKQGLFPQRNIRWTEVARIIDSFKEKKEKAWTGAYMINATGAAPGETKARFITDQVICAGICAVLPELEAAFKKGSRREVWLILKSRPYFGSFMSGQVVDDWGWTLLLSKARDTNTWAPQGPGSVRGFNRVLGLPLKTKHKEDEWCTVLQDWRKQVIEELGQEFRDISLMDLQNCLCETDKYLRVKNGEGRPRSQYKPETAY